MQIVKLVIAIFGRICLSAIFIIAALNKILNWEATKETILDAIAKWHTYSNIEFFEKSLNILSEQVQLILWAATVFELLGGLLVLIGIFSRVGAFFLIVFLIPSTLFFHPFWYMLPPERDIQVVMFMKNLSIFGGLMLLLAFGSGHSSASSKIRDPLGKVL